MTQFKEHGTLIWKSAVKKGVSAKGNEYKTIEFRIKVNHVTDDRGHFMQVKCFGDRADMVERIPVGTIVDVYFFVNSTSWTGKDGVEKWFTNVELSNIVPYEEKELKPTQVNISAPVSPAVFEDKDGDLPFDPFDPFGGRA